MDKVLVQFQNENDEPIFVETQISSLDAMYISAGEPLIKASKAFGLAMRPVLALAGGMMKEIDAMPGKKPDTVELEFGIKMSGAVEAWVISLCGEGNINMKMSWNTPKAG
jgi:hypothetical protein